MRLRPEQIAQARRAAVKLIVALDGMSRPNLDESTQNALEGMAEDRADEIHTIITLNEEYRK